MKNWKLVLGLLILAVMVSGCAGGKSVSENAAQESNKLVVYFSLSGNTKFVAEQIQSLTGADIFELELVEPYSADYNATIERSRQERESDYRPALAGKIENLADYDIIFLGSPNWFGSLSLPTLSFLESHDLSGKTIVPFVTFGRGGFQNTITDLKALLPDAVILEEFGVTGSEAENNQSEISQWLGRIGMIN